MKNYLDKFRLDKKVAFVTGGAGLIGTEVTKALADAGAKVVILDINKEKGNKLANACKKDKKEVIFEKFDITNLDGINQAIDILKSKYGHIDVWVNAAYPQTHDWGNKLEDLSLELWQKNVDMQLNSYAWVSRAVCLVMQKQKRGSLINFGSIYGVVGSNFSIYEGTDLTTPMAYSAIKGGIVNLGRYLASYFGKFNVRVNTICPGGMLDKQNQTFKKNYSKNTPLNRMGKADEAATAVLFLASDASSYITGIILMVDGGWTAI